MNGSRPKDRGDPAATAASGLLAGRYQMERELARGGMGSLWVASDLRLKRRVAVKLIASSTAPSAELMGRFEREACAAAKLKSPHIVQIYDYGFDGGAAYMVMELLEGEDLRARLERVPWLPLEEVRAIVAETAKALEQIHAAGMLHRDLKPANVFLTKISGQEVVKVIDFGVVRTSDRVRWTQASHVLGTPRYMSPEQIRGSVELDARGDLWSLGVIAYRALTGKHPFSEPSFPALVASIQRGVFVPASRLAPELPPAVDAFFARALAVPKSERFATAGELAAAFAKVWRSSLNATRPLGSNRRLLASATELPAIPLPVARPQLPVDETVPFPLTQPAAEATVKSMAPHRGGGQPTPEADMATRDLSLRSHDTVALPSTMRIVWSEASADLGVRRRRWLGWLPLAVAGVALAAGGAALSSFVRSRALMGTIATPVSGAPSEDPLALDGPALPSSSAPISDAPPGSASAGSGRGVVPATKKVR